MHSVSREPVGTTARAVARVEGRVALPYAHLGWGRGGGARAGRAVNLSEGVPPGNVLA